MCNDEIKKSSILKNLSKQKKIVIKLGVNFDRKKNLRMMKLKTNSQIKKKAIKRMRKITKLKRDEIVKKS